MDSLARSARTDPQAIAVIDGERTVSYGELDCAADGVASFVASADTFASRPVAFWGERSVESIAAVWGIPRAGVTGVVVDPRAEPAVSMQATRAAGVGGLWAAPSGGFDRLVERGRDRGAINVSPAEDAYVVFTSGSEATPKGVRLTRRNVTASVAASRERLGNGPGDRWLCVLPLFHVGGLSILWRQAEAGAPVVLLDRFDTPAVSAALHDVTFASFVPAMVRRLLRSGQEWSGLSAVLVGGAAANDQLLEDARTAGLPTLPTYGMSETCSQVATMAPGESLDGSVGRAIGGAEIRVTVDGHSVVGTQGRIEVRGSMVSPGYIGGPDRSPTDWFVTSDMGTIDAGGRLVVLGRSDTMIVTGGENVHPLVVERGLARNPSIRACRVYGVPDDSWGERIVAEVETIGTIAALVDWASIHLPPSHRPREWRVTDRVDGKLDEPHGTGGSNS